MSDNNVSQQQGNDNSVQEQNEQQNQQNNQQNNIVSDENGTHIQTEMNGQPKLLNNPNNADDQVPQQLVKVSPQNPGYSSRSPFKASADLRKSINFGQRTIKEVDKKAWFEEVEMETKQNRRDCSDACCLEVGSHHFCCSTQPTYPDYIEFGVGINLYYRFLKQIGYFFIAFTILALPQMVLSVISYLGSESRDSSNPFEFLMATTIGATSLNNKDCQIQYFNTTDITKDFSLQCESGNLAGNSFRYGIINSNEQDCLYLSQNELNQNTTNPDSLAKLQQDIDSKVEYSFTLTQADFSGEFVVGKRVYAGARCKEAVVSFGLVSLKQKYIPIIFAYCDAAIITLFIYFLLNLTVCESKFERLFQTESPMLQNFSIQISSLPKQSKIEKEITKAGHKDIKQFLLFKIREHVEQKFKQVMKNPDISIYDIQASEQEAILLLQAEIQKKKNELNDLLKIMKKGRENQFVEAQTKLNNDNLLRESYLNFYQNFSQLCSESKDQEKIEKTNNQIVKIWDDIENLTKKIDELQNVSDIKYIWITFDNMKQKSQMQFELQTLPIDWLAYSCCFCCLNDNDKDKLLLKKFKLQIKEAPNPENINWMNLNYSLKQRVFRQFISFLLTIAFLAGSFAFVSWVNQQKLNFQQQYPTINCKNPLYQNVTRDQVQSEVDGTSSIKGYVECYCKPYLQEILAGNGEKICDDWGQKYAFQQSLPWAIVAGLIIINVLIQYIFIFLSSWEKHLMITEEYTARIFKIFLAQFLNTGLILLISNADFGNSTKQDIPEAMRFLFGGKYGDIDSKWCQNIGIVLLLTLLINVATQPATLLLEIILRYLGKAYDQMSCCLNQSSTRKTNKTDFRELYLGEQFRVDLRYAQILTAIYVCLMYSAALPFLYFTTVLTIGFIYAVDKISLFTTYRKPLMLDQNMSQAVRKYLWLAVIIHLGFATYIYGSSNLFYETLSTEELINEFSDLQNNQSVVIDWWQRSLSQAPNIYLLCILALVILTLFLFFFFYRPMISLFSKCFACCNARIRQIRGKNKYLATSQIELDQEEKQFLKFLNHEELEQDLKFTLHQQEFIQNVYDMKQFKIEQELQLPVGLNKVQIKVDDLALAKSHLQQTPSQKQKQKEEQLQKVQQGEEQNQSQNIGQNQNISQDQNISQNQNISQEQNQFAEKKEGQKENEIQMQQDQNNNVSQFQAIPVPIKKEKHLVGLRSYHISYNPNFSKYYEWERIKQQNIMNE